MVKQRMATADVAAEVACLRPRLLGMRLANIYDVNAKVLGCPSDSCRVLPCTSSRAGSTRVIVCPTADSQRACGIRTALGLWLPRSRGIVTS